MRTTAACGASLPATLPAVAACPMHVLQAAHLLHTEQVAGAGSHEGVAV